MSGDKVKASLRPETIAMGGYFDPSRSEGAVVTPIFLASNYAGRAVDLAASFDPEGGSKELLYARLNNPGEEIFERRFAHWDSAEESTLFASGMAAIETTLREFLEPRDLVLFSEPLYGCTDKLLREKFPKEMRIIPVGFSPHDTRDEIMEKVGRVMRSHSRVHVGMIFIETPQNPTVGLVDIEMCAEVARAFSTDERQTLLVVDNTFMGPLHQKPLLHGADIVVYSATKYIGGHSDLIAGICSGDKVRMKRLKDRRALVGNMPDPFTDFLLERSLKTLKVRMEKQAENAARVADFLSGHPRIERVYYPGLLRPGSRQFDIYKRECLSAGAMMSFDIAGGDELVRDMTKTGKEVLVPKAFRLLDNLEVVTPAVSLGSVESLAQHPARMTHASVSRENKNRLGITDKMIRFSTGIEHVEDIIEDLGQALDRL